MKYTLLPPQKSPRLLTAYRASQSLGEHLHAFLSRHNQHSRFREPEPEKTFDDWVYALAAVMISANHRKAEPTVGKGIVPVKYVVPKDYPLRRVVEGYDKLLRDESRDAALSFAYNEQPLNDSEYLARRQKFLADDQEFLRETAPMRRVFFGARTHFTYRGKITDPKG